MICPKNLRHPSPILPASTPPGDAEGTGAWSSSISSSLFTCNTSLCRMVILGLSNDQLMVMVNHKQNIGPLDIWKYMICIAIWIAMEWWLSKKNGCNWMK